MGPTSLYNYMLSEGLTVPKNANALGANLWAAWKAGRIKRATNGVYTPLDECGSTVIDHPITDYDALPPDSPFPVPAGPIKGGTEDTRKIDG
jgi:hypothetical protein